MKLIHVGSDLSYIVNDPTSFLFQVSVSRNQHQYVTNESIAVYPFHELHTCCVGTSGNVMHRLLAQVGEFTISYRATVELHPAKAQETELTEVSFFDIPADVLPFLNPSRYCESDKLLNFSWNEFGNMPPGYSRAQGIADWVHDHLSYTPGSTDSTTTACDVLIQRTGVCRDYAHLAIALSRALGIPARYVAGYAVDLQPPDFHGFYEVYLGNAWYLLDATRLAPVSGFVRIGAGRDAADVSFATLIGASQSTDIKVWAQNDNSGDAVDSEHADSNQAISSA